MKKTTRIALSVGIGLLTYSASAVSTITNITLSGGQVTLEWEAGFAPFQAQSNTLLGTNTWTDFGSSTFGHAISQTEPVENTVFFRILGNSTATTTAQYQVTFNSTWSATTHPTNFPSPNEHYSPLIGGTHNQNVSFWQPGGLASQGIETMAETGSPGNLTTEVNAAITAGNADAVVTGGGLGVSPGSISTTFNTHQDFPLVTIVTMIAPSPDWFVGVHDLNLFVNGDWVDSLTVVLDPYDAGTDDGTTYIAPNADTSPQETIQKITGFPLEYQGAVAPFGTFEFTRLN